MQYCMLMYRDEWTMMLCKNDDLVNQIALVRNFSIQVFILQTISQSVEVRVWISNSYFANVKLVVL